MATLNIQPDHLDGLRYVVGSELENACDEQDLDQLRDLIALGDQIGWAFGWGDGEPNPPGEVQVPDAVLSRLVNVARQIGGERMSDLHWYRAQGDEPGCERCNEPLARSLLAFAEQHWSPQEGCPDGRR